MALELEISGLEGDRYLFNNPVWVDVTEIGLLSEWLNVTVTRNDTNTFVVSRMFIYNDLVSFDISEYIKGLADYPHYPDGILLDGQEINTNYYEFDILFQGVATGGNVISSGARTKTFLRGGLERQSTNNTIPNGTLLKDSVDVPSWNGFEFKAFRLVNNKIVAETSLDEDQIDRIPVVGCNSIYVRWINLLGGYSFWLFENWDVNKKSDSTDVIMRRGKDISTGHQTEYTLALESRVDRRFFKLIRGLIQSPEVAILGLSARIDTASGFIETAVWEQIWNDGNSTSMDEARKLNNVKLKFDFILKHRTQTVWS